jgi:hypothetical protein
VEDLKTYLSIIISSEGGKASKITEKLCGMGFETAIGSHDFVYDWKNEEVTTVEVTKLVDNVQEMLKGMDVKFNFTTLK